MTFKFPGMDRFAGRGNKAQEQPTLPDDMRAVMERANKAYARLSKGGSLPPIPTGRPLSDADKKSVARVVEELTGKKVRGRVNDPEVPQRLGRLFGGGAPTPVAGESPERPSRERPPPEQPPPEQPAVYRQAGRGRIPPRF